MVSNALQVSSKPIVMTTPSAMVKMNPAIVRRNSIRANTENL